MIRIVILEDEPVIARRLQRQLEQLLAGRPLQIKWFDELDDAQSYLSEQSIDLLMLDLNLHGLDGFDLLRQASAESFYTIIVSAYAEQAIKAFEFGVLDFVAKPFNIERLRQAIDRYLSVEQRANYSARKIAVKKAGGLQVIDVDEIACIRADGHYTQLVTGEGAEHLHDKAIDKIEKVLPANFVRIHRSHIVDMARVRELRVASGGSYQVILACGTELPVSRSRYKAVREKTGL